MFNLYKWKLLTTAAAAFALWIVAAPAALADQSSLSSCILKLIGSDYKGPCGALLTIVEHVPTVTLKHVKAIGTGSWRDDIRPISVYAGTLNAGQHSEEPIELEIYAGGWGVMRTDEGWFPVTSFNFAPSMMMFDLYAYYQISPGFLDRQIVKRAATLLSNTRIWNRADDRNCPMNAVTLSIYCAMEKATIQITGGFQHTRPALQIVRDIVSERSAGRKYHHLLMDYNNDPRTGIGDVQAVFKEALEQMQNVQWLETNGFVHRLHNSFQPG